MAFFDFVIPSKLDELLGEGTDYRVKDVVVVRELQGKFQEARQAFKEEGIEFILENFDTYYSVLHHESSLQLDVLHRAYLDLHRSVIALNKSLSFLLEDKASINDEVQRKYQSIMKMIIYLYEQTIIMLESRNIANCKKTGLLKGRKKIETSLYNINKMEAALTLNNILQTDIAVFWDPPVVEENFTNIISEVCYKFLQDPLIKSDKPALDEIFNLIGTLIKTYNHSTTFTIRMVQMIKDEEHLLLFLSDGVKRLVENYNCKGLVHALVREITEWQTDERFQDSQGSRYCCQFLVSLAVAMPDLMLPELLYLNKYLGSDPPTLRNCILNIITEVLVQVLSNRNLTRENNEYRDEFLNILEQHLADNSAHVRTKVMQHWSRLQQENAIPTDKVNEVLRKIVQNHLYDKAALVRKSAINCVNSFLEHNTHSACLSMTKMKGELEASETLLETLQPKMEQAKTIQLEQFEQVWLKLIPDLKKVVLEVFEQEDEEDEDEDNLNLEEKNQVISMYMAEGRLREAFQIWKKTIDMDDFEDKEDEEKQFEMLVAPLKDIFMAGMEKDSLDAGISQGDFVMTADDFKKYEALHAKVQYFKSAVEFLELLDEAMKKMPDLLETTSIGDMHEAIAFFTAAYHFSLDNADIGISAMLRIMRRNEQDRKDAIIEAFKSIYLKSSAKNMQEHCTIIVKRLIHLLQSVLAEDVDNLESIISQWVSKGSLDNSVIDMLWQFFTKKVPVTDDESHASCELLRMAALGRRTVITRNIKLVTTIAFETVGNKNLALLGTACDLLAVAGRDRIDMTSSEAPFRIAHTDKIFKDLFAILTSEFFNPKAHFYHRALSGGLEFVYKICGKPDFLTDQFIKDIGEKLLAQKDEQFDVVILTRICQMVGLVAIKQLDYLDETVYKETKRRQYVKASKNEDNNKKKEKEKKKGKKNVSAMNATETNNETALEGATAEDDDADFILSVLEKHTVTGSGLLAQFVNMIVSICEKPHIYNDIVLQGAATTALIRFMILSSEFCSKHIRLLFTVFEKTEHPDLKVAILGHMSDLLTRFPNIIEPWTPRIFDRLDDPSLNIRKTAFFTLSGLILRDMIRAHSRIHLMVHSLVDPDRELNSMGRNFFNTLAHKENNLYNVLPDIFSHLMESSGMSDENVKTVMTFLFELMEKSKHVENLVDRFCLKFSTTEDLRHQRNIAYCLALMQYNDKALRKLIENFSLYKHLMHDEEIYASFRSIMQAASKTQVGKQDLKPIVEELNKAISSVFEINGEQQPLAKKPAPPKTKKGKAGRGRKKSKKTEDYSDSE